MTLNPAFDFSVDKENKTIRVKREFAAALSLVWDAYTKREILDQWWAPKPWKAKTKRMDFREGGHWLYAMVGPAGEEHWARADFQSIEFQKSYTYIDAFTDTEGNINTDLPSAKWKVNFVSKGSSTLVDILITYADLKQLETIIQMGFREGFSMAMDNLDELLRK
ncbi:MAG: SRPBCC domain-containing protein [Bacteroidetes bacterium]|nr:SRPBCC domain-containing protein [Bacteroidota bacterium]